MTKVKDSVKRDIVVNAPIERVWEALTRAEHLNRWYTKEAEIDFQVGGRGRMNHGWGAASDGIFTEIVPMKRFVLQSADGDFTTITSLEESENGILVSIEYQASFLGEMDPASKENMLFGTTQFLENLKSVYETGADKRASFWQAWIGIVHTTEEHGNGTKVVKVKEGSSASAAGIQPDDTIKTIDGEKVTGHESFERLINQKSPDAPITLTIDRENKEKQVICPVEAYPVSY
ncbi:SRPBCC domain-containing protein [Alteribacter lacisalsi]|nr:SRPBCC domain-containing protein [Alteribacter lacisalsi]